MACIDDYEYEATGCLHPWDGSRVEIPENRWNVQLGGHIVSRKGVRLRIFTMFGLGFTLHLTLEEFVSLRPVFDYLDERPELLADDGPAQPSLEPDTS